MTRVVTAASLSFMSESTSGRLLQRCSVDTSVKPMAGGMGSALLDWGC